MKSMSTHGGSSITVSDELEVENVELKHDSIGRKVKCSSIMANIIFSLIWLLFIFLAFCIAVICALLYIIVYCIEACIPGLKDLNELLHQGVQLPNTCASKMMAGAKPTMKKKSNST